MEERQLPQDPDWDHVPPELAQLDGEPVTITAVDRKTGELVRLEGTMTPVPGLHGDAARQQEG